MKSSKYYKRISAECPYYKRETKQLICCTGFKEQTTTHIAFTNGTDKKEHIRSYCCKNYRKCPLARVLEKSGTNNISN